MSLAILLAFSMALITGTSNIILKKGFSKIEPTFAVYLSVVISTFLLWVMTFLFVPKVFFHNYKGILIFAIIGSFAPTIVRSLTYIGIHKLGAGRSSAVRSLTPFFAVIMAIVFLKETPNITIFLGVFLIIIGIILLSKKENKDIFHWKPIHLLYPLGAAFLAGLAANLRKYGLNIMPQPIFASTIAATSSAIILTIYIFKKYQKNPLEIFKHPKELKFIIIAACLTSIGEVVDLSALLCGKVTLVIPIFATTPLIIVILSKIFLEKHEIITRKLIYALILIVLGVFISINSC